MSSDAGQSKDSPKRKKDPAHAFIADVEPFFYGKAINYVDVGAFRGGVLREMLASALNVREAHLIEPNPSSFSVLKERAGRSKSVKYLHCHNVALGKAAETLTLRDEGGMSSVVAARGASTQGLDSPLVTVEATTLDDLARQCALTHVSILKIDVEGHELDVLEGCRGLLEQGAIDLIYIEAGLRPGGQQTFYRDIEDALGLHGYRVFRIYEQMHEWMEDSPLLRRMNVAFMNESFAAENPRKVTLELYEAKRKVAELETEIASMRSAESCSSVEMETQRKEIMQKDEEASRLRLELEAIAAARAEDEARIASAEAELVSLREAAGLTIKGLTKRLESHETRVKDMVGTVQKYERLAPYAKELEARYMALLDSTSWRITKPLRYVLARLRKRGGGPPELEWRPEQSTRRKGAGNPVRADHLVRSLRRRMLDLGFVDAGLARFEEWVADTSQGFRRRLSARELVNWFLNQGTVQGAERALAYIDPMFDGEKSAVAVRRGRILEAEAYLKLGRVERARHTLLELNSQSEDPDVCLALANSEVDPEGKVSFINRALQLCNLEPIHLVPGSGTLYDRIRVDLGGETAIEGGPLVSVIMPAYNSEAVIAGAIESVLAQTWKNLELLIVDDCSTDGTVEVIERYCRSDGRARLIRAPINRGAYVARNLALKEASGDFVTCHDADDWSHPRKIEVQVRHLLENPVAIANQAVQARSSDQLQFNRRGNFGFYIFSNLSSLMFRRLPVAERLGFWDCVRFMGDGEFLRRLEGAFGSTSVVLLDGALTSFQRWAEGSLTENGPFGFQGFMMGARREYFDASFQHHEASESLFYGFPQAQRPFSIPHPMRPECPKDGAVRHYDVIIISDFRLAGGSTLSSLEEVQAQAAGGLRTGLIQMSRFDIDPSRRRMNRKLRGLVNAGAADVLVYGEKVSCDVLIIRYPPVLQYAQKFVPEISAKKIKVIINQPPMSDYGPEAVQRYRIPDCEARVQEMFGGKAEWYPIGPIVREALHMHHSGDLDAINLSPHDWVNIIDVSQWRREARPTGHARPRIGRHARDHDVKWPGTKESLLTVYPDSDAYEVYVMGGAAVPTRLLGGSLPDNWTVVPFDGMSAKDYLSGLDVFVYFTHVDWVESFGRVIIEAMAVGVPVILPHLYADLFEDAAIYAEPAEVLGHVDRLVQDPALYQERVERALAFVDRKFGYRMHLLRVLDGHAAGSDPSSGVSWSRSCDRG